MNAALFDLDGTLLNTLVDIGSACNEALANNGYPQHPIDAYRLMVGNGFPTLVKRSLPQDRMPDACGLERITKEAAAIYAAKMMDETRPYPGVAEALAEMQNAGIRLGVLSNKPDSMSVALAAHYFPAINFADVRGGKPGAPLKPQPDVVWEMLAGMGAKPGQSVYVGDSNVDMLTAKNAGMIGIGAAWGFRGPEELEENGATIIVEQPCSLASAVISALRQS